jgi:hypothetical protein
MSFPVASELLLWGKTRRCDEISLSRDAAVHPVAAVYGAVNKLNRAL